MLNLSLYFYEYVHNLWDIISLTDERTVSMSVNLEQEINNEEENVNTLMNQFIEDINAIS